MRTVEAPAGEAARRTASLSYLHTDNLPGVFGIPSVFLFFSERSELTVGNEGPFRLLDESQRRRLGVGAGLCDRCSHSALADSERSLFVRCERAGEDSRLRRYPVLPVECCVGYQAR